MGRLVVDMFVTLDGVIQAPGGPDEDTDGGFPHGGWQGPFFDEESGRHIGENLQGMDALLLGRRTYDIFSGYWPNAPADDPFAVKLNNVPKYVASHTLERVTWKNTSLIAGDLDRAIDGIKKRHGETHVIGSANLVQSLLRLDVIDRLTMFVYPVVLGAGKRLFAPGAPPTRFKLIESRPFSGGAVLMAYEPAGRPSYVDMANERQPEARS